MPLWWNLFSHSFRDHEFNNGNPEGTEIVAVQEPSRPTEPTVNEPKQAIRDGNKNLETKGLPRKEKIFNHGLLMGGSGMKEESGVEVGDGLADDFAHSLT